MKEKYLSVKFAQNLKKIKNDSKKPFNFRCDICYVNFATISSLIYHTDNIHKVKKFQCSICKKNQSNDQFEKHISCAHDHKKTT